MRITHASRYDIPARAAARSIRPAGGWQVREDGGYYLPEPAEDDDRDPALSDAVDAYTKEPREAMALLDDAENLLGVLAASVEHEGDSRAMQAETVLKIVRKKLRKAHRRIDRQEFRDRDLFLAYFELKGRSGKETKA